MSDNLKPVLEGVFTSGPDPKLLGGECPRCAKKYFPAPGVCPGCLGEVRNAELCPNGRLHSFTVVRTKPPYGLPQPYPVGYIDLEADGLRVFSLLDPETMDGLRIGQSLSLRVGPIGVDGVGRPCLRYYFTPGRGGHE